MARLDNLDYEVNGVTTNYEIVPEIAPLFNATTAYAAGDTVIEEGHLYRFNTAHAAGAWIGTDADEITVGEELTSHGADITELKADFTQLDGNLAATMITNTASGSIASFPDGADNVPVKDLTVQIVPVQSGSGDPSPENVRPISGWTGCKIYRTGVNIIDRDSVTYSTGKYINGSGNTSNSTNYKATGYIPVPENTKIVITGTGNSANTIRTAFYADKTVDSFILAVQHDTNFVTATTPSGARYMRVSVHNYATDPLCAYINEVSADTAYTGNTYSIDWTTEAGTVYGGTLDVTTGVLTVDRITKTLDENASWSFSYNSETGLAQASINNVFASEEVVNNAGTPNYCNQAVFVRSESGTVPAGKFTVRSYARNFRIGIDGIATEEAWISHVTSNPIQICMVLSPSKHVTYQLTLTEVSTLLGQNHIWCDCGNVSVDYRADTKLYIENLTAPSEDDMVANTNIPSDTYFMIGNTLFLSTTTIPAGDTINPGTNCTLMNLASALNALNS